jgi:predicted Rossmann fold nucleotide-binding protein DprA/Smf involved in DNA uptake
MSATNPDAPFSAGSAMNRNKYVYSLSMSAFIVASDFNKGGTWAGAVENMKNDWVKSFVFKSEKYSGNMELIRKGARPVSDLSKIVLLDLIQIDKDMYKQVNVFELSEEMTEQCEKYFAEKSDENQLRNTIGEYDLYFSFIKSLGNLLVESKSLEEIMILYNTNKSQTLIWLHRALEEKIIIKNSKPVKYALKKEY